MTLSYNNLIGIPVFDNKNNKVGMIKDVVLDPESGLFLSLVVANKKYILVDEIKEFNKNKIIIKENKSLKNINEISENIKNIIREDIKIKNNKVYTTSGENLGKVSDFEIDLIENKLSRIYVSGGNIIRKLIRGELIINRDQIVSIEKDKITVEDIIARKKIDKKILPEEEKSLAGASFCIKIE